MLCDYFGTIALLSLLRPGGHDAGYEAHPLLSDRQWGTLTNVPFSEFFCSFFCSRALQIHISKVLNFLHWVESICKSKLVLANDGFNSKAVSKYASITSEQFETMAHQTGKQVMIRNSIDKLDSRSLMSVFFSRKFNNIKSFCKVCQLWLQELYPQFAEYLPNFKRKLLHALIFEQDNYCS